MIAESTPRNISSCAVAPLLSSWPAGNSANETSSSSTKRIPSSPVLRSSATLSNPIRRSASRPGPRTSTFWPAPRNLCARSTSVTRWPARRNQKANAGPAILAPETRTSKPPTIAFPSIRSIGQPLVRRYLTAGVACLCSTTDDYNRTILRCRARVNTSVAQQIPARIS